MVLLQDVAGTSREQALILWFEEVGTQDVGLVGGKNSSLGEMIQQLTPQGINVPTGFATTAYAFRHFIESAGLDKKLRELFRDLDVNNVQNLQEKGKKARRLILNTPFPSDLSNAITIAYRRLCERYGYNCAKFAHLPEAERELQELHEHCGDRVRRRKTCQKPVLQDSRRPI
jgi:pyruvate, water dikinase